MAKSDFEDGVWRTIGGRRIFIKDGEDLSAAMKKSGKFTKEQKKAKVEVKDSDFDKNFKDMSEDELKEHLNKLESGMDDFDEDEPQFKELQKEYNEAKKALDQKSEENEILKNATAEERENYYKNKAEIEKRDKIGQTEYLMEKQRERGNSKDEKSNELQRKANEVVEGMAKNKKSEFKQEMKEDLQREGIPYSDQKAEDKWNEMQKSGSTMINGRQYNKEDYEQAKRDYEHAADKYEHYKFNGADDEDRIKYKKAKDEAYDNYVKQQREYDENRLKPKSESYTQKDLDNAKAKMLEMEGTLDDAESDPSIKRSAAYKDIKKEYNDAKAEYDKISNSLREAKASNDAKQKTLGDRIINNKTDEEYKKYYDVRSNNPEKHDSMMKDNEYWKKLDKKYGKQYEKDSETAYNKEKEFINSYLPKKSGSSKSFSSSQLSNQYYAEYYKKENLGTPSNYQKGDKIEFNDGYYNTIKGSIVREATNSEKQYTMNSNLKGYIVRDSHGNEHVVPDTRIKEVGGTDKAYKSAYEDYKKKHPNTKLSYGQFVDMSEGK